MEKILTKNWIELYMNWNEYVYYYLLFKLIAAI